MDQITLNGFLARLGASLALVAATFNPTGHSFIHWIAGTFPAVSPIQAIAGLVLLGAWVFFVHATWRALGSFGVLLGTALCAAIIWWLVSIGWLRLTNHNVLSWVILFLLSLILAIGVSFSIVQRRVTGQVAVDEVERR